MQGDFVGTFHRVEAGYGFMKDVRRRDTSESHPDVFVRATVLKRALDWKPKTLTEEVHRRPLYFQVRPSERFPGKLEAWALRDATDWHVPC